MPVRTVAARVASVVGHPALLMPVAAMWAASANDVPPEVFRAAAAASILVAAIVVIYSVVRVRSGQWSHVDASAARERDQLNRLVAVLCLGAAALSAWTGQPRPVVAGLAIGGMLVVVAQLLRTWMTVSLHAAFAVFAIAFVWPRLWAVLLGLALAAAVSWSRVVLRRHDRREVLVGLLAGAAAACAFRLLGF